MVRAALAHAAPQARILERFRQPMPHEQLHTEHPDELTSLRQHVVSLEARVRWRGRVLVGLGTVLLGLGVAAAFGVVDVRQQLTSCRAKLVESRQVHSALVRDDAGIRRPADEAQRTHLATAL
jgi:hypothetical protein